MEISFFGFLLILFILFLFRSSVKKLSDALDEEVTMAIVNNKMENMKQVRKINNMIETSDDKDMLTPQEIYDLLEKNVVRK